MKENETMAVMFDKLLGNRDMQKYKIVQDQLHTGDEQIVGLPFFSDLVFSSQAEYFLYITAKISDGIYKGRFIVFQDAAHRMMFVCDHKGQGSNYMDELSLTFLN